MVNHVALLCSIGLLTACGGKQGGKPTGGTTDSQELAVHKVQLSSGIELEYAERGAPGGTPVLLIHGVFDSRHTFDRMLPLLPASYHIYAIDLRGHGNSGKPDAGYSQGDLAGDVIAFLDAVKEPRVNIVGHSMGTLIGHKIAVEHPDRLDKLVLISGVSTLAGKPSAAEAQTMFATLKDPIDPNFVGEFLKSSFVKMPPQDYMQTGTAETLKIPAKVWNQVLAGAIAEDHSKDLSRIKAPTLLLWGDKDPLFDRNDQKVLDDSIPDSTLKIYPGVGHGVPGEEPEQAARDIVEFLR